MARALAADVSLMNELDDIHRPQGALLKAQRAAAALYGADRTFFSVNGTTGALQAMILGGVAPGEKIILPRDAHRAAIGALILSGARPVYIAPEFDAEFGVALPPPPAVLAAVLKGAGAVKALLLTSPNYYGIATDTRQAAQIAHENGALLLVDEAHGAHLGFHDRLPASALASGADASAQSTHKLLGALTQASLLHVKQGRLDVEPVAEAMSILTTTSPNQLLLASLDAACRQLAGSGRTMMEKAVKLADYMRAKLDGIDGLRLLSPPREDASFFDVTKITVNVAQLGLTGFAAAGFLRKRKIAVELADNANILFLITYADKRLAADTAVKALRELARRKKTPRGVCGMPPPLPPKPVLTPREAFYSRRAYVPLAEAAGRVAAQDITFYPPGIPLVLPGELITKELAEYARTQNAARRGDPAARVGVVC
jgi:arginine/lysine/ornithine decarboxylase